jgi:hypothetical protein
MQRKPRLIVVPPQHLGHELHISRVIICDMFKRGFISTEFGDKIITGFSDRTFLYEKILNTSSVMYFAQIQSFKNILIQPKSLNEYIIVNSNFFLNLPEFQNFDIVNLKDYAAPNTYCNFTTNEEMNYIGYYVPSNYYDEKFIEISKKFNFINSSKLENIIPNNINQFIVIHHRYDASIVNLKRIVAKFSNEVFKIIFCHNLNDIILNFDDSKNLKFIDNLKDYASILNDVRCKILISEWSGGGQISQYILGSQGYVWYYYDSCPDIYNFTMTHKIWETNAKLGNYFNCWDFKCVSGCNINHFANLDSLLSLQL